MFEVVVINRKHFMDGFQAWQYLKTQKLLVDLSPQTCPTFYSPPPPPPPPPQPKQNFFFSGGGRGYE